MTSQNQSENGKSPEKSVIKGCLKEPLIDFVQESQRAGDTGEKLKVEPGHEVKPSNWDWGAEIIWLFIAIIIMVSAVAGYLLWVKLSFHSP